MTTPPPKLDASQPAFPNDHGWARAEDTGQLLPVCKTGMTLRAYIATAALQGILASYPDGMRCAELPDHTCEAWADGAVRIADSLIERLKR